MRMEILKVKQKLNIASNYQFNTVKSTNFIHCKQRGKSVKVQVSIPIIFKLD